MKRLVLSIISVCLIILMVACNQNVGNESSHVSNSITNGSQNVEEYNYKVLEALGRNTLPSKYKINHNEEVMNTDYFPFDLKHFGSFDKNPAPKKFSIELQDGLYEEVEYFGSNNDYYFNSERDMYRKDVDGTFLEIYTKVNTGDVYFCLYDSDENNKKYENAPAISSDESIEIAKDHFSEYVGSEEFVRQFEFFVSDESEDEYIITGAHYINGLKTYEEVQYMITIYGRIISYYIDVDTEMDITKCPNDLQMKSIKNSVDNKLKDIYDDARLKSYSCKDTEPCFVRLYNGSYALEYNYSVELQISNNSEPQYDNTRLFVILE